MREHDCGEIPVVRSETDPRPIGVVTDRDITTRAVGEGKNSSELKAKDCMSQPVVTIRTDQSLEECIELLERHHIRRVPVVDVSGQLRGIVAQADFATKSNPRKTAELLREVSQPAHA